MASNSIKKIKDYRALVHIDSHLATSQINNTSDVVVLFCLNDFTKEQWMYKNMAR